eukprot:GHVU01141078.1.p1 GENE.GHVU01141078.1~~GHVU01141078.1.p1  ORF type:complete len:168 (-),score=12.19 GHVU01141078.1:268-771(-)
MSRLPSRELANSKDLAMDITIVSPKEMRPIKATETELTPEGMNVESTVEYLLGRIYDRVQSRIGSISTYENFGFLPPRGMTDKMQERKDEESGKDLLRQYHLDVYMRDVEGQWHWLTSSDPKDNLVPSIYGSVNVLVASFDVSRKHAGAVAAATGYCSAAAGSRPWS